MYSKISSKVKVLSCQEDDEEGEEEEEEEENDEDEGTTDRAPTCLGLLLFCDSSS